MLGELCFDISTGTENEPSVSDGVLFLLPEQNRNNQDDTPSILIVTGMDDNPY